MAFSLGGFAAAFSQIENELESAVKDKDFDADAPSAEPAGGSGWDLQEDDLQIDDDVSTVASAAGNGREATGSSASDAAATAAIQAKLAAALAKCSKLEAKLAEKTTLCNEKDAQIAATLEEGEQLSIRQAEQEKEIRTLRASTREAQQSAERTAAELGAAKSELNRQAKALSAQASAAGAAAGAELSEALSRAEAADAELHALKAELSGLRERHAALSDEHRALGLARAAADAREAVAAEALREVQAENARLFEAGRWRDEGLTHQLGELTARTDAAEAHASELAAAVAHATKPLLRQLASLQAQQAQMAQAAAAAETELHAKLAASEASIAQAASKLEAAQAALLEAKEREAALGVQIEQAEEERGHGERTAAEALEAARAQHASVREQLDATRRRLDEAHDAAAAASEAEAKERAKAEQGVAQLRREREAASEAQRVHAAELRAAQNEAAAAASAAAAVAVARGAPPGGGGGAADNGAMALGGVREMRGTDARLQEGELVAVRKLLAASERKQQALLEQLATERHQHEQAGADAAKVASLVAEYAALNERHQAALEMLGEKEEERMLLEDKLLAVTGGGAAVASTSR